MGLQPIHLHHYNQRIKTKLELLHHQICKDEKHHQSPKWTSWSSVGLSTCNEMNCIVNEIFPVRDEICHTQVSGENGRTGSPLQNPQKKAVQFLPQLTPWQEHKCRVASPSPPDTISRCVSPKPSRSESLSGNMVQSGNTRNTRDC